MVNKAVSDFKKHIQGMVKDLPGQLMDVVEKRASEGVKKYAPDIDHLMEVKRVSKQSVVIKPQSGKEIDVMDKEFGGLGTRPTKNFRRIKQNAKNIVAGE